MVITEVELREAWRDGRGSLPEIPPGARLTPAARDFLAALERQAPGGRGATPSGTTASGGMAAPTGEASRLELRSPDGRRLILTAADVDDLVSKPPATIVVHPSATLTDAARERLVRAGVRVVPWIEPKPTPAVPPPAAPQPNPAPRVVGAPSQPSTEQAALRTRVKTGVLARLGDKVDSALLDTVISRVLADLGEHD